MILVGIDPGIVDTAAVKLTFNFEQETWSLRTRVWSNVTERLGLNDVHVQQEFLDDLRAFCETAPFIEGFRQRGRDTLQDQRMLALIRELKQGLKGSTIVDNTGIRKIVTEPMMKLFEVSRFPGTNHADLKSAARVALAGGIKSEELNPLLARFVTQRLLENKWTLL